MEIKLRDFESQILYFNGMYKLPVGSYPTTYKVIQSEAARRGSDGASDKELMIKRIQDFMSILTKEISEGDDMISRLKLGMHEVGQDQVEYKEIDFLTDMADWLADIQVYCASEMAKYGLPLKETLRIVMSSNFSKLDVNGNPIYDSEGKVLKGPMYWKPEPQIKAMLEAMINDTVITRKAGEQDGIVWPSAK